MPDYWINVHGGTGDDRLNAVAVDSLDNIIVTGETSSDGAGGVDLVLEKYDSSGSLIWKRALGGTSGEYGEGVAIDSSDNIVVTGICQSDGAGSNDILIAKFDSSGTLQWDRTLGGTGDEFGYGIAVDSSDNIIISGRTTSDGAGDYDLIVAKYNSSGTLQWDRTLGGTSGDESDAVTIDSSDNIIVVGRTSSDGAGLQDLLLAKYNSSGTLQWDRTLGGISTEVGRGVALDSSENIIVVGQTNSTGAGGYDALIAKYNSSGTLQWQRTLGGSGTDIGWKVVIDSSDNIIINGYSNSDGAGGYDILIAKFDSSGTLQWDRTLGGTGTDYGHGIAVDSLDNIIITAWSNSSGAGSYDLILAKLPSDGTGTGVYGPFTYQDAVLTSATSTLTDAAAVLTDAPAVLTDAAAVLTETKLYTLTPMTEA